jgi:hypothetical protein
MGLGDGGSGVDQGDRAQNIDVPLGKILRFDVSGNGVAVPAPDNPFAGPVAGHDAVWCYGLRNPWRCSFDRATGDLVIADVGQSAWEEIDFAPASADRGKGWDWGWRCYEGNTVYTTSTTIPCGSCTAPGCDLKFPAWVYSHTLGRCSVTGGYVYRGVAIPDLQGTYFFADFCGNQIYSGTFVGGSLTNVTDRTAELAPVGGFTIESVSSFGEDAWGELYICDLGGEVFKVVPASSTSTEEGTASVLVPTLEIIGPMPFRDGLRLQFGLPQRSGAQLEVFDARGRRVRHLVDGIYDRGRHPVNWDGRDDAGVDLGSGLYFVRFRAGDIARTVRVVKVH